MLPRRNLPWDFLPWGDELNEDFRKLRERDTERPEQALCRAIINRAFLDAGIVGDIRDSIGSDYSDLDFFAAQARRWVNSDSDRPFGFLYCLDAVVSDERAAKDIIEFARAAVRGRRRRRKRDAD